MKIYIIYSLILLNACSFFLSQAEALNPRVSQLIEFETEANAVSTRSKDMVKLPHVDIPLKYLISDFAKRTDFRISKSLLFKKDGIQMVRWILNPEDTKWGDALIKYFNEKHQLVLNKQYYFHGYKTSSRSYIAEDPMSGAVFSVKSSTNVTGGYWSDKKQPLGEAIDSRIMSDFLYNQKKKRPFVHFIFMDEPAILGIKEIDQAVVIRDLNEIKRPDRIKYYLPGFSALHEKIGKEIAAKNGSSDPYEFWTENYVKVAGRALGELAARTGLQFDSPHSQNFLIELNHKMQPTGKLVIRDMADLYVDKSYIKAIEGEHSKILEHFTQKGNLLNSISAGFGPLHGNKKPSWVSETRYSAWNKIFFESFESSFLEISGYDLKSLKSAHYQSGDYFSASYRLSKNAEFSGLYDSLKANGYLPSPNAKLCAQIFMKAM